MGERIGASIRFGGHLRGENVQELIDLLKEKGLTVDFDESTEPTADNLGENFGDWQVNYGNLDELTTFAGEHHLDYLYWFDSGSEWLAATERYFAATNEAIELTGDQMLSRTKIEALGSYEAVIAYLDRHATPLPPLVIV